MADHIEPTQNKRRAQHDLNEKPHPGERVKTPQFRRGQQSWNLSARLFAHDTVKSGIGDQVHFYRRGAGDAGGLDKDRVG